MMHPQVRWILGVSLFSLTAFGEPFYLRHEGTGDVFGPFDTKAGSEVTIGRVTFTVVRPDHTPEPASQTRGRGSSVSQAVTTREKLRSIILPQSEFRQADFRDVIDFFIQAGIAHDPAGTPGERGGVNIVVNLPEDYVVPPITCSLRQVPLETALEIVTQIAQLKYLVKGPVVMIVPKDYVGPIHTRQYPVTRYGAQAFAESTGGNPTDDNIRNIFIRFGVDFPPGSSIAYIAGTRTLIVSNSGENLESFERIYRQHFFSGE